MYGRPSGVSITCPDQRCVISTPPTIDGQLPLEPVETRRRCRRPVRSCDPRRRRSRRRDRDAARCAGSDTDRRCPRTARRAIAPLLHAAADDVAGVERELGLEQRRAEQAGVAHQRRVRREHDVAAGDACGRSTSPTADRRRTPRPRECSKIMPPRIGDRAREAGEVLARMKPRLTVERACPVRRQTAPRPRTPRRSRAPPRARLVAERDLALIVGGCADRRVQIAGHPLEVAVRSAGRATIASICPIAASPASHAACA